MVFYNPLEYNSITDILTHVARAGYAHNIEIREVNPGNLTIFMTILIF